MSSSDLATFTKMQSQERTSITSTCSNSPLFSTVQQQRAGSRGSFDYEQARNGGNSFDGSLPLQPPQSSSSSIGRFNVGNGDYRPTESSSTERHHLGCTPRQRRENCNSDSAISSTSENEDIMSSMESESETTPAATLESDSTHSTLHASSIGNSGSSEPTPAATLESDSTHSTLHASSIGNSGSSEPTPVSPLECTTYNVEVYTHYNVYYTIYTCIYAHRFTYIAYMHIGSHTLHICT